MWHLQALLYKQTTLQLVKQTETLRFSKSSFIQVDLFYSKWVNMWKSNSKSNNNAVFNNWLHSAKFHSLQTASSARKSWLIPITTKCLNITTFRRLLKAILFQQYFLKLFSESYVFLIVWHSGAPLDSFAIQTILKIRLD